MDQTKIQCEYLIDENLHLAHETLNQLEEQDKQLNNVNSSLFNVEYYSKKSKDILKRMDSFFKRLWYRPVSVDITREYSIIQMNEISIVPKKEGDIIGKLGELKQLGLKIGETLDNQNALINEVNLNTDKNNNFIDENNKKIKNLLG